MMVPMPYAAALLLLAAGYTRSATLTQTEEETLRAEVNRYKVLVEQQQELINEIYTFLKPLVSLRVGKSVSL